MQAPPQLARIRATRSARVRTGFGDMGMDAGPQALEKPPGAFDAGIGPFQRLLRRCGNIENRRTVSAP
jgi:hypothetical protein